MNFFQGTKLIQMFCHSDLHHNSIINLVNILYSFFKKCLNFWESSILSAKKKLNDATRYYIEYHAQTQGRNAPTKMAAFHIGQTVRKSALRTGQRRPAPASPRMKRKTRGKILSADWLRAQLRHLLQLYYRLSYLCGWLV